MKRDLSDLRSLNDETRLHAMKSLSALSKFLGIYDEWQKMVKNYGLKWNGRSTDDLIIARLTKTQNPNEVFEWIKTVKKQCPELSDFLNFMSFTGMRLGEAVESYNLVIRLASEGKLNTYYNAEKGILEHYRFKNLFLRKTKKAFFSFIPRTLLDTISKGEPLTQDSIECKLRRRSIPRRFGDIREVHGTLLTRWLSEPEINFLHGRISASVFMRSYFNPSWLTDLKARTFKGTRYIEKSIS
jgi:intergrase/recombinase